MLIKPQIDQAGIILSGTFEPSIFLPTWFAQHQMIGKKEAENLEISPTKNELEFKVDAFKLRARPNLFEIVSSDNHFEHVRDLVISCFGKVLPSVPIKLVVICRRIHFDAGGFEVRDRVGSRLAPKEPWGKWGEQIKEASSRSLEEHGGMISITMYQPRIDFEGQKIDVQAVVEPSFEIEDGKGIFVEVHNYFRLDVDESEIHDALLAVRILENHWESSLERAEMIFDQIMELTKE